jgi:hypothetical protein
MPTPSRRPLWITLAMNNVNYIVPMKCVVDLLQDQWQSFATGRYTVQSAVSQDAFGAFVVWLAWNRDDPLPWEHAAAFVKLATEFRLPSLLCKVRELFPSSPMATPDSAANDLLAKTIRELERSLDVALGRIKDLEAALAQSASSGHPKSPDGSQPGSSREQTTPVVPLSA